MSFAENGYKILRNVFQEEHLQSIRTELEHLLTLENFDYEDPLNNYFLQDRFDNGVMYDVYQRFGVFRPLAENKAVLDTVEEILGKSFYLYVNSFLYKPGTKDNEVPWHQDFLSRPNESEKILAWMAIDDATIENGCLKVIPGSHKKGFRDWYRVKGATHHDRIKISEAEVAESVHVEMKAGDVLIFSNYLIHGSDENNSTKPRRAFRAVYKKLDDANIPRGVPIMMRYSIDDYRENNFINRKTGPIKGFIHRVGNYLSRV